MNLWTFLVQNRGNVADLTVEHLWMVGISTLIAVAIGIPLGILIARRPVLRRPVIATANIIQTVPSLALFGFLLPAPWIGDRAGDRKSTRLNSSHRTISYAVFCLKKKKHGCGQLTPLTYEERMTESPAY